MITTGTLGGTASNTVASTTLQLTTNFSESDSKSVTYIAVAIQSATVTVQGIAGGSALVGSFTFISGSTVGTTRVELWKVLMFYSGSLATCTITFTGSVLASAAFQNYLDVVDTASVPLIRKDKFQNNVANITTTAGNLLLVTTAHSGAANIGFTLSDAFGTVFTRVNSQSGGGVGTAGAELWAGIAAGTGYDVITSTMTSSNLSGMLVSQYSNMTAVVDKVGNQSGIGTGYTTGVAPITTTNANDLVYAVLLESTGNVNIAAMPPFGVLNRDYNPGGPIIGVFGIADGAMVTTTTGTYSLNYSASNSNGGAMLTALKCTSYTPVTTTPASTTVNNTGVTTSATITPQFGGSYNITAYAAPSVNGDTISALTGTTLRRSVVPTVSSVCVCLVENSGLANGVLQTGVRYNTSRAWVGIGYELLGGDAFSVGTVAISRIGPVIPNALRTPASAISATAGIFIGASVLGCGTTSLAYSETMTATGGTVPYTFSVVSGSLPTGLSLNSSTGVISGIPTVAATSTFTLKVVDALSNSATGTFSITVSVPASGGSFTYAS